MNELDLLSLLRDEVPLTEPSPAVEHAVQTAVRAQVPAGAAPRRGHPAGRPRGRAPRLPQSAWQRRMVVAGLAAAAVAGAAILVTGLSARGPAASRPGAGLVTSGPAVGAKLPTQRGLGKARTEAQLIDYATRSAAASPAFVPSSHEWVYTETEVASSSAGGGGFLFGPPNERVIGQEWARVDQRLYASYVHGHLRFGRGGGPGSTLGGWKSIRPSYLNSLPTRPAQLEAVILANNSNPHMPWYVGPDKNYTIFNGIFTLMSDGESEGTWIPPKLLAAMYRILASLPGVHFDLTTDLAGRSGMGFYMLTGGWEKQEIVIDPATYAYMGDEWVAVKAHTSVATDGTRYIKKGQVLGWEALLHIAVVRHAGQI
jgi:hypothetical protein